MNGVLESYEMLFVLLLCTLSYSEFEIYAMAIQGVVERGTLKKWNW